MFVTSPPPAASLLLFSCDRTNGKTKVDLLKGYFTRKCVFVLGAILYTMSMYEGSSECDLFTLEYLLNCEILFYKL